MISETQNTVRIEIQMLNGLVILCGFFATGYLLSLDWVSNVSQGLPLTYCDARRSASRLGIVRKVRADVFSELTCPPACCLFSTAENRHTLASSGLDTSFVKNDVLAAPSHFLRVVLCGPWIAWLEPIANHRVCLQDLTLFQRYFLAAAATFCLNTGLLTTSPLPT